MKDLPDRTKLETLPTVVDQVIELKEIEPFKASEDMPYQKGIAMEHLEICKGCVQRTAQHAMDVGRVLTDLDVMKILDENTGVMAQSKANHELSHDMFIEVQSMLEEIKVLMTAVDNEKNSFIEMVKTLKLKGIPLAYKVGTVLSFAGAFIAGIFIV